MLFHFCHVFFSDEDMTLVLAVAQEKLKKKNFEVCHIAAPLGRLTRSWLIGSMHFIVIQKLQLHA